MRVSSIISQHVFERKHRTRLSGVSRAGFGNIAPLHLCMRDILPVRACRGSQGFQTLFEARLLHVLPLFSHSFGERLPDLLSELIVTSTEAFKLLAIPLWTSPLRHETFVSFSASVRRLGREMISLNLTPSLTTGSSAHEHIVIMCRPRCRRASHC